MSRIEVLAARVRWLDRYRRLISISVGVLTIPLALVLLGVFGVPLYVATGCVTWWVTEIVLAYWAALWETECEGLVRERGLPRAMIVRK